MKNDSQQRGCIAPIITIFFMAWICYGLFFMVALWLTRGFVWQHVLIFAGTMALITTIAAKLSSREISPTNGMLVHLVKIEEIEQQYGADNLAWNKLKQKLQKGDQIWLWAAFGYSWMALGGRYGYVIVRDGQATEHFIFIEERTPSL